MTENLIGDLRQKCGAPNTIQVFDGTKWVDRSSSLTQEVSWMRRKTLEECANWIEKLSPLTKDVKIIAKFIRGLP